MSTSALLIPPDQTRRIREAIRNTATGTRHGEAIKAARNQCAPKK
ncbi:MAG: hypothetical protein OEZ68_11990 [Gammaproteobacteria bacterium]|nr:hypothetical protein [Gammaproteobacteria bacterium]MDH5801514.1 hypothetical protein [Gammaproteobacteria bacterium]